jgi:hypothetical protein
MPIDSKEIKQALDDFEKDDFLSAKDRVKREVKGAISDFFKDKLELKKALEPSADTNTDGDVDTGGDADTGSKE